MPWHLGLGVLEIFCRFDSLYIRRSRLSVVFFKLYPARTELSRIMVTYNNLVVITHLKVLSFQCRGSETLPTRNYMVTNLSYTVSSVSSRSVKSSTPAMSASIREYLRNSACSAASSSRKTARSVSSSKAPARLFRCHFAVKGRIT